MKKSPSQILQEISLMLEILGDNPFRARAFARASRIVADFEGDMESVLKREELRRQKGIGEKIWAELNSIFQKGFSPLHRQLQKEIPSEIFLLLQLPGLGPSKVRQLFLSGITNLEQLKEACRDGSLLSQRGFGKRTVERILEEIDFWESNRGKWHLPQAQIWRLEWEERLRGWGQEYYVVGEFRRGQEWITSLEFLVLVDDFQSLWQRLQTEEGIVAERRGEVHIQILNSPIPIHFYLTDKKSLGAGLAYYTGSSAHLQKLQDYLLSHQFKLTPRGLIGPCGVVEVPQEDIFFEKVHLPWIPPELREGLEELEWAKEGKLPELVSYEDIEVILHNHTDWSDGKFSIEEMSLEAHRRGFRGISINDHSASAVYAGGLSPERVERQLLELQALSHLPIRIFSGIECDIRKDGSLDLEADLLARLEVVIAAVHSHFQLSMEQQTRRICRAISHSNVDILAHPTGRLLLRRRGYEVDWVEIFQACCRYGVAIELNANPYRLELDWRLIQAAKKAGVRFAIGCDAHHVEDFGHVSWALMLARKGGLERGDIVNYGWV
ncbi:MAG: DNA polymerase/3'-5' exonuclease PolX [Planctomycetota bacterium]|nr:MAG: DNA polymerase/3'-5' exonuclease PolX [Planctomycetota bacterium]